MTQGHLQSVLLKYLAESGHDNRIGDGRYFFSKDIRESFKPEDRPNVHQIMAAVWSLIGQGLAYLDYSQPSPGNWVLRLTESGFLAAKDELANPNSPGDYLKILKTQVPDISNIAYSYVSESVFTFNARCYLASSVMIGVASEAAFLEMAKVFASWLPTENEKTKFSAILESRNSFFSKFDEFRKRIETYRKNIPEEISNNLGTNLLGVGDLIRSNRNDSGHPTGRPVKREDAFICLQMFIRYSQRLYELKHFFENNKYE